MSQVNRSIFIDTLRANAVSVFTNGDEKGCEDVLKHLGEEDTHHTNMTMRNLAVLAKDRMDLVPILFRLSNKLQLYIPMGHCNAIFKMCLDAHHWQNAVVVLGDMFGSIANTQILYDALDQLALAPDEGLSVVLNGMGDPMLLSAMFATSLAVKGRVSALEIMFQAKKMHPKRPLKLQEVADAGQLNVFHWYQSKLDQLVGFEHWRAFTIFTSRYLPHHLPILEYLYNTHACTYAVSLGPFYIADMLEKARSEDLHRMDVVLHSTSLSATFDTNVTNRVVTAVTLKTPPTLATFSVFATLDISVPASISRDMVNAQADVRHFIGNLLLPDIADCIAEYLNM